MKKFYLILMAVAALSFSACQFKPHYQEDMPQDEDPDKYPAGELMGYLGNDLAWEDIADVLSDIHSLKYIVTGSNDVHEEKEFDLPWEASEWIIPLPEGEYDVLVATNMNDANGFVLGGTAPTKAGHTLPATYASLKNPSSNPLQAWNGIAHVKVEAGQMSTVHLELDRLLSIFTLKINNVPAGTAIDISMRNVASYVTLTELRSEGHYGLPSQELSEDITLGQLNADNATSAIDEFKVFPTATGLDKTILFFHIKTNKGLDLDYVAEAPRMENGKKYVLELDYNKLTPYMYITSTSINEWTDGWGCSGEILNPQAE